MTACVAHHALPRCAQLHCRARTIRCGIPRTTRCTLRACITTPLPHLCLARAPARTRFTRTRAHRRFRTLILPPSLPPTARYTRTPLRTRPRLAARLHAAMPHALRLPFAAHLTLPTNYSLVCQTFAARTAPCRLPPARAYLPTARLLPGRRPAFVRHLRRQPAPRRRPALSCLVPYAWAY